MPDHPFTRWGPAEIYGPGVRAATYDPRATSAATALTAGVISLCELYVPEGFDCTKILLALGVAGVTLTNTFVGIYDDQGVLIAQSVDQSSSWAGAGAKEITVVPGPGLTAPIRLLGTRRYYVAMLVGTAATLPQPNRASNAATVNSGTVAPFRSASTGSGLTALPASIALGGVTAQNVGWWVGLA